MPAAPRRRPRACRRRDADERRHLVIGDSWSVGLGPTTSTRSWPASCPARSTSAASPDRASAPGPAAAVASRSPTAHRPPLSSRPDLVVVEGGLNDYDQPASAIDRGFRDLMAGPGRPPRGRRRSRDRPVPRPAPSPGRRPAGACSPEYAVPYVATSDLDLDYLDDLLHLTEDGHEEFGEAVAARIADVTPTRPVGADELTHPPTGHICPTQLADRAEISGHSCPVTAPGRTFVPAHRALLLLQPRGPGVEGVGPAQEVGDQVGGVLAAAHREHRVAVGEGDVGAKMSSRSNAEKRSLAMTSDHM